jgi:hypothetical protein
VDNLYKGGAFGISGTMDSRAGTRSDLPELVGGTGEGGEIVSRCVYGSRRCERPD